MNVVAQHEPQVAPVVGAKILHGLGDLLLNLISSTAVSKNQDLEPFGCYGLIGYRKGEIPRQDYIHWVFFDRFIGQGDCRLRERKHKKPMIATNKIKKGYRIYSNSLKIILPLRSGLSFID